MDTKIALLSYSGSGINCKKTSYVGPIQSYAAVDPIVGKQQIPHSPVAVQANVLIFPDRLLIKQCKEKLNL
ncbi:MAG: phosphate acyltransferase [Candidatus Walczuchella monophlebidarum]